MSGKKKLYRALLALNGRVPGQAEWRAIGQACGYTAYRELAGSSAAAGRRRSVCPTARAS